MILIARNRDCAAGFGSQSGIARALPAKVSFEEPSVIILLADIDKVEG
jgi:hypothetical protein